jgi:hypothetical protein
VIFKKKGKFLYIIIVKEADLKVEKKNMKLKDIIINNDLEGRNYLIFSKDQELDLGLEKNIEIIIS